MKKAMREFIVKQRAWLLWCLLMITAITSSWAGHFHRSVTHAYRSGALHWLHGLALYSGNGKGFIYFPQSAILYIPFASVSIPANIIVWCLLSVSLFAYGIYRLLDFVPLQYRERFFFIMTLIAVPIAFSDARNGQMNLIMAALMFLATTMLVNKQWNKTALFLMLAFALKPISIVLVLLFAVLYPRLLWRVALGMVILFMMPFLTQDPGYVWSQYHAAMDMLHIASHVGSSESTHWAQLFNVLAQVHWDVSQVQQRIWRIVAAFVTLTIAYYCKRKYPKEQAPFWILLLAMNYLMLFNPRTENNTYAILAPLIGYFAAYYFVLKRQVVYGAVYVALAVAILFASNIGSWIIPGQHSWVTPLVALIFTALSLVHIFFRGIAFTEAIS